MPDTVPTRPVMAARTSLFILSIQALLTSPVCPAVSTKPMHFVCTLNGYDSSLPCFSYEPFSERRRQQMKKEKDKWQISKWTNMPEKRVSIVKEGDIERIEEIGYDPVKRIDEEMRETEEQLMYIPQTRF